jgi:molybdopterin molybdotransferase
MISYAEAIKLIDANTTQLGTEVVPLQHLLHRVLAMPLVAPFDMPQFDNSSVDGYAVKVSDVSKATESSPVNLKLVGKIQAGAVGDVTFNSGETIHVFTGATVPKSADAVIMQEHCRVQNGFISVLRPVENQQNVRQSGAEFRSGTELLSAGTFVTPPVIGLLASLGFAEFSVGKLPSVAVIVTGDELVNPGNKLAAGQIYDANSPALLSALASLGLTNVTNITVQDNPDMLKQACSKALESDLIILSGGVSVGDYDFVKDVLEKIGVETVFWQVSIKPGKPLYFGKHTRGIVFGLPGNTVSSLVTFHQFVKPALRKMAGLKQDSRRLRGQVAKAIKKRDPRLDFMRGTWSTNADGRVIAEPTIGQQSHMLSGLAFANCLINVPLETESVDSGDVLDLDQISWTL